MFARIAAAVERSLGAAAWRIVIAAVTLASTTVPDQAVGSA
jgi:hypothetical protein